MYVSGKEFGDFLAEVSGTVACVAKCDTFSVFGGYVVKKSMEGVREKDALLYDLFQRAAANG